MNYTFPAIKTSRTSIEQLEKVFDEYSEAKAEIGINQDNLDKEMIDILHSAETLIRVHFRNREDVLEAIIKSTIVKNTKRGYYESCY